MKPKKGMLTSHELGFYKDFDGYERPKAQKVVSKKPIVVERDYLYLYLRKIAVRGKVSITQKDLAQKLSVTVQTIRRGQHRLVECGLLEKIIDADPVARQPTVFKVKTSNR